MSIVNTFSLQSNRQIKINFDGGDLSSDAGLLLIKEFISRLGIERLLNRSFKTNVDLDSTLLAAYGKQEGRAFNFHYQSNGYHPLVCYDGITGDLIKIQLRDGAAYSCTGVTDFLQPILDEYLNDYPTIHLLLRGDSGFATPDLYKQCEENGTSYVIRLKENKVLREKASFLADALTSRTQNNKVDYAVVYGEFMYKAGPWPYERRVVCKVEKPENQMVYMYTFIVTNMDSSPNTSSNFTAKEV